MIREASIADIEDMHRIRMRVTENRLNNPDLVREKDYEEYLSSRGKGWVSVENGVITGFAIVDMLDNNVWALFVDPEQEGKGFGKVLQSFMLGWYFQQTGKTVWLSTAPGTRAERFYRKSGWKEIGITKTGEIRFEMTKEGWGNGAQIDL